MLPCGKYQVRGVVVACVIPTTQLALQRRKWTAQRKWHLLKDIVLKNRIILLIKLKSKLYEQVVKMNLAIDPGLLTGVGSIWGSVSCFPCWHQVWFRSWSTERRYFGLTWSIHRKILFVASDKYFGSSYFPSYEKIKQDLIKNMINSVAKILNPVTWIFL